MGRIRTLTPAQGTNYRTEYAYNANGSVATVTVYDAGTAAVTSYAYSATTGRLSSRSFPESSGQYVKTAYSYDAYGRLEYETVTRETGSTTNLYRTQYAYSRIAFGIQLERTEQAYSGGAWANSNKTQYQWDTLGRQAYEQRYDWDNGTWSTRYDITQVYDKNGNRTEYDKNVAAGYTADYGKAYNLSYTYDSLNQLTAIMDSDDLYYSCSVTSDANMNITLLEEKDTRRGGATLYSYFEYDALNRMTAHKTKANLIAGSAQWWWTKRAHQYDAVGRLVRSTWKTWPDGQSEPGGNSLEHVYAGAKHVQNYDGTNYGRMWHWAGAEHAHMGPLSSPNADTASQQGYNLANGGADVAGGAGGPAGGAGGMSPQKRTFLSPTTEGDQRHLFGQGRPMAKDSSGSGSAWATGTVSRYTGASGYNVESRLMFEGTVAATDMSRATDTREKDRIGIFGTGLSYAGSYGRVTSETIGRDLNPLGRGAGQALIAGMLNQGLITPVLPKATHSTSWDQGNSVNNQPYNDDAPVNHPLNEVIDEDIQDAALLSASHKLKSKPKLKPKPTPKPTPKPQPVPDPIPPFDPNPLPHDPPEIHPFDPAHPEDPIFNPKPPSKPPTKPPAPVEPIPAPKPKPDPGFIGPMPPPGWKPPPPKLEIPKPWDPLEPPSIGAPRPGDRPGEGINPPDAVWPTDWEYPGWRERWHGQGPWEDWIDKEERMKHLGEMTGDEEKNKHGAEFTREIPPMSGFPPGVAPN